MYVIVSLRISEYIILILQRLLLIHFYPCFGWILCSWRFRWHSRFMPKSVSFSRNLAQILLSATIFHWRLTQFQYPTQFVVRLWFKCAFIKYLILSLLLPLLYAIGSLSVPLVSSLFKGHLAEGSFETLSSSFGHHNIFILQQLIQIVLHLSCQLSRISRLNTLESIVYSLTVCFWFLLNWRFFSVDDKFKKPLSCSFGRWRLIRYLFLLLDNVLV